MTYKSRKTIPGWPRSLPSDALSTAAGGIHPPGASVVRGARWPKAEENNLEAEIDQVPLETRPRLWNPRAAGVWGILLSPPLGAFLHAANWRALGRPEMAAASMRWFWGVGVLQVGIAVAALFVPFSEASATWWPCVGFTVLAFWAKHAERQVQYVKATLKTDYPRRSWGAPLAAGIAFFAVLYLVPTYYSCAFYVPDAAAITAQMRPLLLREWRKDPVTRNAKITEISIVRTDGGEYSGLVEATFGEGVTAKFTLDVAYDSGTIIFTARPLEQ